MSEQGQRITPEPQGQNPDADGVDAMAPPKSPGIYVHSDGGDPKDLDLLWGTSRSPMKEDRSPVVFTLLGVVIGVILTSAVFYLFFNKPQITSGQAELTEPIEETADALQTSDESLGDLAHEGVQLNVPTIEDLSDLMRPNRRRKPAEPRRAARRTTTVQTEQPMQAEPTASMRRGKATHTVENGDTLGSIAEQYYDSSKPEFVEALQRANGMSNPNALSLGQKLVIPTTR